MKWVLPKIVLMSGVTYVWLVFFIFPISGKIVRGAIPGSDAYSVKYYGILKWLEVVYKSGEPDYKINIARSILTGISGLVLLFIYRRLWKSNTFQN